MAFKSGGLLILIGMNHFINLVCYQWYLKKGRSLNRDGLYDEIDCIQKSKIYHLTAKFCTSPFLSSNSFNSIFTTC